MLKYDKYYLGSDHTVSFINPRRLKKHIAAAVKCLKKYSDQYDTLAFAGISGAVIGPIVAMKLKKECILVRKDGDKRHSLHEVAGYDGCQKYIMIDDFVSQGDTARMVQRKIHKFAPDAKCLGVLEVQYLKGTGSYKALTEISTDMYFEDQPLILTF